MKKLILLTICFTVCIVYPAIATQVFNFENSADTAGWEAAWNSGTPRGTITLSIVSSDAQSGSACLMVYCDKTSGAASDGINFQYYYPTWQLGDTVVSIYAMSSTAIQPPWFYTKAYSKSSTWTWNDTGVQANLSSSWAQYVNYRSDGYTGLYNSIGFQIWTGTDTGTFIFLIDSIQLADTATPSAVGDWNLYNK